MCTASPFELSNLCCVLNVVSRCILLLRRRQHSWSNIRQQLPLVYSLVLFHCCSCLLYVCSWCVLALQAGGRLLNGLSSEHPGRNLIYPCQYALSFRPDLLPSALPALLCVVSVVICRHPGELLVTTSIFWVWHFQRAPHHRSPQVPQATSVIRQAPTVDMTASALHNLS